MSIFCDGLLGALLGETPSTQYDAGRYQEQALREMLLGQRPNLGPGGSQLGGSPFSGAPPRPRKHVESREVSPREIARKQIQGAVEAVKKAQEKAK